MHPPFLILDDRGGRIRSTAHSGSDDGLPVPVVRLLGSESGMAPPCRPLWSVPPAELSHQKKGTRRRNARRLPDPGSTPRHRTPQRKLIEPRAGMGLERAGMPPEHHPTRHEAAPAATPSRMQSARKCWMLGAPPSGALSKKNLDACRNRPTASLGVGRAGGPSLGDRSRMGDRPDHPQRGRLHLVTRPELASLPGMFGLIEAQEPSGGLLQTRLFFDLTYHRPRLVEPPVAKQAVSEVAPGPWEVGRIPVRGECPGTGGTTPPTSLGPRQPAPVPKC